MVYAYRSPYGYTGVPMAGGADYNVAPCEAHGVDTAAYWQCREGAAVEHWESVAWKTFAGGAVGGLVVGFVVGLLVGKK